RVGAVHRAALEGLARSARRLGPARHTTPVSTVWATWAEAGARWPAWGARVRPRAAAPPFALSGRHGDGTPTGATTGARVSGAHGTHPSRARTATPGAV